MHEILLFVVIIVSFLSKAMARPHEDLPTHHPTIRWRNCTLDVPRLQCGEMAVPIDYGNPTGESITIRMARLKSTNNGTAPLGTLLINLGGPGAPTAALIKDVAKGNQLFSEELMANYDIVGLDPRGVGTSNPVKCNQRIWNERVNLFPTTEEEYQSIVAHNKALGESCAKLTGNLINHLDTAHVVEDFEMFRLAINNGGLNLLAWSYGTQIAIQYAEKYPENVNRFVLDGITDHTLPETTTLIAEAATYEATLNQFFLWCNTTSDCLLQGQNVAGLFDSLVKTAASSPIPAPNCNSTGDNACFSTITASDILTNVQFLLAGPNINTTWPELSSSLAAAAQGNAGPGLSTPIATSDNYNGYAFLAIACQDWLHESSGVTDVLEKQRMAAAMFPHTRGASESYYAQVKCIGWPALTTNPQHVLEKKALRAPPMLLVNALWDPETSIVWATGVARQLEETGSVLVTRDGAGHTSYLGSLEGETRGVEEVFLLTGVLPAKGLVLRS